LQADAVKSLCDDTGQIGHSGIDYHDYPYPPQVPKKKQEAAEKDDPMGEFSPAGLFNESLKIFLSTKDI